jgi:hypothetical protein
MRYTVPPEVLERLRDGKRALRSARMAMSLPEKVREVVKLQEFHIKTASRRRPLEPHERVWKLRDR